MPRTPSGLPVLARGKHRSPRRGACLMEYASLLAGERWSDAPSCTHPALAALARAVNDCIGDAARQQLTGLAPELVGAQGAAAGQLGPRLARKAVLHALRVTTGVRRRTLLVALLAAHDACDPQVPADPDGQAVLELLREPDLDVRAAVSFAAGLHEPAAYNLRGVTTALHLAVKAISDSGGAPADRLLHELLVESVALARVRPLRQPVGGG